MKRLLIGEDALVAEWTARKIPHMRGEKFGPCVTFGVVNDQHDIIGAVVFHEYIAAHRAIQWSAASTTPDWLTLKLINVIMAYPFTQLGCQRITALIPRKAAKAEPARKFHRQFGFKHEGTIRRGFGGDDAMIFGLL